MEHTDRMSEERYLKQTLKVVERNLENYRRESTRMQGEIDEMLEHYHDADVELWTLLNNTITLNEHMKRALVRNERAMEKPYFGRIIFHDLTLDKEESLYIGKGGISSDHTHQIVVDWRAPVANAYYENGLGECSYTAPDGTGLAINLLLKRTYEIEKNKLLNYFDTEVIANDDLLMKYLSKNKEAVLGEIVATIQKEQNEIIRKTPCHNIIVQGVAGSGKTTVAMHRISYILYNYKERFRPEDFYIVGSNRILLNYITGVLPDLDVFGVRQMTMEQLFVRLLYEDWDEKKYKIRSVAGTKDVFKGTEKWYLELVSFIRRLEQKVISTDSVYLNPRQFVEGLQDGASGIYDKREEDKRAGIPSRLVRLVSGESVERYVVQNPAISIQSKINMLNERLQVKIKDEFLGKGVKYTEPERKAIRRAYRGWYGDRIWKTSIYSLYQEFMLEQQKKGLEVDIPSDTFDVYDLAALALLYKLVKETEVISEAHHVVIDEAQDFGMMAYHVLHDCIRDCTYTIMGDVSQNIHFGYGLGDWEELRQLFLSDSMDSFGILKKSYRNTVEISDFATNILQHGNFPIYPVEPIIRHGNPVMQKQISGDETVFARAAADVCREWQKKDCNTIAVVCRNEEAARKAAIELGKHITIMESDLEKANFGDGILVLPVEYTKGLEFDAVLIWNPSRTDYPVDDGHARLLYVAATRALHELCVLYRSDLTGLIVDPLPERKPEFSAENQRMEKSEGLQEKQPLPQRESLRAKLPQTQGEKPRAKLPQTQGEKPRAKLPQTQGEKPRAKLPQTQGEKPRAKLPQMQGENMPEIAKAEPFAKAQTKTTQRNQQTFQDSNSSAAKPPVQPGIPASPQFGDMPATEKLRPMGHAKINSSVRWITKQSDGLYLQSQYGILRISPVGSAIIRFTFTRSSKLLSGCHPLIAADHVEKNWKFRDNGKVVELVTGELILRIDKSSGSIQYLDTAGHLLLAERKTESRQQETGKNRLYLDLQKGEQLYAMGQDGESGIKLRSSARYISASREKKLPFLLSDKGYGILPATDGICFFCDVPAYSTYLYTETEQMDYYFISGKQQQIILKAYSYLTGLL